MTCLACFGGGRVACVVLTNTNETLGANGTTRVCRRCSGTGIEPVGEAQSRLAQ